MSKFVPRPYQRLIISHILAHPRGGEIRYHAELSCAELDAMARNKEVAHESGD